MQARSLIPTAFALALSAGAVPAQADDTGRTPPSGAADCVLEEKCPKTGVLCDEDRGNGSEHCPQSQKFCDEEGEDRSCADEAEASGLEERCDDFHGTLYCAAGEAPVAGTPPGCAAAARAAGLTDSCLDYDFAMLLCHPKEVETQREGGDDDDSSGSSGSSGDDGCTIRRQTRRSGAPVAFAVLVVAGAVTGLRAWRRGRGATGRS